MNKTSTHRHRFLKHVVICAFHWLIACGLCGVAYAHKHYQQILDTKVTVSLHDVSLEEALHTLETLTNIRFYYSIDQLAVRDNVSLSAEDEPLGKVLKELLSPFRVKYKVHEKRLAITLKRDYGDPQLPLQLNHQTEPMRLPVPIVRDHAATITGIVTDAATGLPMAGVNIIIKGTTEGTTTDKAGAYAIQAEAHETLVVTFIGFMPFETEVGNRTVIDISLEEDMLQLRAVEVVGTNYWLTTKQASTSSIAKVTAKDIEDQPVTNPLMALQGRVPGLTITPYSGTPGAAIKVQIRGQNSLRYDGGYPLYVIDGVPVDSRPIESASVSLLNFGLDPLSTINPANIEHIEILKDADATAIYGSRGANGVIVITTKTAQKDEATTFHLDMYTGVGTIPNKLDMLNTEAYVDMRKEAYANDNANIIGIVADDLLLWDTTRYTNWQRELLGGSATVTDIEAGIAGGNRNTSFRFAGGYHKEDMIFPGDFGYDRATASVHLHHTSPSKKLNLTLAVNYGSTRSRVFNDLNYIDKAISLPPNAPPLYDENGELNWALRPNGTNSWTNPMSYLLKTHETLSRNLVANSTISYLIVRGLRLKTNLGFTELNGDETLKRPIASTAPSSINAFTTGSGTFGKHHRRSLILEPQLHYVKELGSQALDITMGATLQNAITEYQSLVANGYSSDALLNSLQGAASKTFTADNNNQYRYAALFARIGYNWMNKYYINLTGRRDGSSRFGPGNRFGNFGAAGVAWLFSSERFIADHLPFLSFGKIRASYGTTGNDQIGDYRFYDTYRILPNQYQNTVGLSPDALFNPDFAWEVTKKLEAALELSLIQDRIGIEVSWYKNRSSNQLIEYQLPALTGFQSILTNLDATIENRGWEFTLTTKNLATETFQWTTSLNVSFPRNSLIEFPGIEDSPYAKLHKVGEPLSVQRVYKWNGVNPETGLHELDDINDDGSINDEDMIFMNSLDHRWLGGLNNSIRYKNFQLAFLLQFSSRDAINDYGNMPGMSRLNQPVGVLDRWRNEGDKTEVARYSQDFLHYILFSEVLRSDYNISRADFIRLKTASLSYQIPSTLLEKVFVREARIYAQGQNLITMTDVIGLDPDTGNSLPPLKIVTLGLSLKF